MPTIPPYAFSLFGEKWSGFVWMSINPFGRLCWWLAFREGTEAGYNFRCFVKTEQVDQFLDMLDEPN